MLSHIKTHLFLLCSILCVSILHADFSDAVQLTFDNSHFISQAEIEARIDQPFRVENILFDPDILIDLAELYAIIGFAEGDEITPIKLKQAINSLLLKYRFEEIELYLYPGIHGVHMRVKMRSFWALKKLKIHGWIQGKEKYRALYLIEPGEKFDESKHAHSIKKIKDSLYAEGYLHAEVFTDYLYDPLHRMVTVALTIQKNKKIRTRNIKLVLACADPALKEQTSYLHHRIHKLCIKPLKRAIYTKSHIQEKIRELKQFLHEQGYYGVEVHIIDKQINDQNEIDFTMHIELAGRREFFFLGNQFFSSPQLRELIFEFGKSAWLVPVEILSQEIEKAYHQKGFWFASIRATDEGSRYLFVIDEGIRVTVDEVVIRGSSLEPNALKKSFFSSVLSADYYDENTVSKAVNALRSHYQRLGYIDATIVDYSYQEKEKKGCYTLCITVDEGVQWTLKKVSIPEFPELELLELFRQQNVPFNAEQLEEQRAWLLKHFMSQGYAAVRVVPEVEKDESHGIHVVWHVTKGEQVRFGKTILSGTSTVPYWRIARELEYKQGDPWNPQAIKKSFTRLKQLQIFDSIQLHQAQLHEHEFERTMVLKLIADDPYEVRLRLGAELQYIQEYRTFGGLTYKVGGSFLAKNPFNRAGFARIDSDFTRSHFEVYASYRQPWFFSLPLRTMIQLYAIKHDQPGFVGNTNNLYRLTQYGGLINVGRKNDHLDASVNFGFEWMETKLNEPTRLFATELAHAMNFDIQLLDKNIPYFLVEPTVLLDFVDNNLYPRKGSLTLFSLKGMIPVKMEEVNSFFIKLLLEQTIYIPVDYVTLALRVRFGHIFYQDFSAIMPSERFYLGGSQSIRSYNADLAPPLGVFLDPKGHQVIVPRGGKTMVNGNIEIRIPVHTALEGVLFQDMGMLSSDNFATFKAKDILAGSGFGVRLKTPIGPLRFDVGFKWRNDVPLQPRWAWTFMFGQAY